MRLSINENFFKIRKVTLYHPYVKNKFRIASLGDIHFSEKFVTNHKLNQIAYELEAQNPNYIFLLGDIIDYSKLLENKNRHDELLSFFERIATIAPCIIIIGNHDYMYIENREEFYFYPHHFLEEEVAKIRNIYLLNNSTYKDDNLFIMGYFEPWEYYYNSFKTENPFVLCNDLKTKQELYQNLPEKLPKFALLHSGQGLERDFVSDILKEYDAIYCGHTHNGCVPIILDEILSFGLLKNIGIISPQKDLFPTNVRGISKLNVPNKDIPIIHSGGITPINPSVPLLPFANRFFPMHMDITTVTPGNGQLSSGYQYRKTKKDN